MFVYLFIGFIVMFLLYNLFSKKKSGTSNRPSKNEDQISAVQKNVSMAGLSLKSKFKIPDQGGVITISLPQVCYIPMRCRVILTLLCLLSSTVNTERKSSHCCNRSYRPTTGDIFFIFIY